MNRYIGVLVICILALSFVIAGDTATYSIDQQNVKLVIKENRDVDIEYDILITVKSGHIPWVTVGLPTNNFSINDFSGSVTSMKNYSYGSWYGVYTTLDKDYQPGETLNVKFSVTQHYFLYEYQKDKSWSISFVPNWWDNAKIETMSVSYFLPNTVKEVKTTADGAKFDAGGSNVSWTYTNVEAGGRRQSGMIIDSNIFNTIKSTNTDVKTLPENIGSSNTSIINLDSSVWFILVFGTALFLFLIIFNSFGSSSYKGLSLDFDGDTEVKRKINMTCPNDEKGLEKHEIKDVMVDYCPDCGGIFFDNGEVEKLIKANIEELKIAPLTKKPIEPLSAITICPRCSGAIRKKIKTTDGKEYNIFVCDDCEGIWMNYGTYDSILKNRIDMEDKEKKEIEKAKKEGKTIHHYHTSSNWWFFPYIGSTGHYCNNACNSSSSSSSSSSTRSYSSSSYTPSCACVACACVASCACACACAGGGAAGCSPKGDIESKMPQIKYKYGGKNV